MATQETNISKKIQLLLSGKGCRLFRNNTGMFLSLDGKRKQQAGLGKDTSDLIGWTPVKITVEMVGKTLAVFTAIEVKTPGKKPRPGQQNYIDVVNESGGLAGFATCEDDAKEIISSFSASEYSIARGTALYPL